MTLARGTIIDGLPLIPGAYNQATLTDDLTIAVGDAWIQKLDPGGSARTVTLPDNSDVAGAVFFIINAADASEDITVEDSEGNNLLTVGQNESGLFILSDLGAVGVCVLSTTASVS